MRPRGAYRRGSSLQVGVRPRGAYRRGGSRQVGVRPRGANRRGGSRQVGVRPRGANRRGGSRQVGVRPRDAYRRGGSRQVGVRPRGVNRRGGSRQVGVRPRGAYRIFAIFCKFELESGLRYKQCCGESRSDPLDPYVFGPPGSGFISQRYGSGSFYHYLFVFLSSKNDVNVPSKRNMQKKKPFLICWRLESQ